MTLIKLINLQDIRLLFQRLARKSTLKFRGDYSATMMIEGESAQLFIKERKERRKGKRL